mgnify:CR=1 FL=1
MYVTLYIDMFYISYLFSSSSCWWWEEWTATCRLHGATGTRLLNPTGSRSLHKLVYCTPFEFLKTWTFEISLKVLIRFDWNLMTILYYLASICSPSLDVIDPFIKKISPFNFFVEMLPFYYCTSSILILKRWIGRFFLLSCLWCNGFGD